MDFLKIFWNIPPTVKSFLNIDKCFIFLKIKSEITNYVSWVYRCLFSIDRISIIQETCEKSKETFPKNIPIFRYYLAYFLKNFFNINFFDVKCECMEITINGKKTICSNIEWISEFKQNNIDMKGKDEMSNVFILNYYMKTKDGDVCMKKYLSDYIDYDSNTIGNILRFQKCLWKKPLSLHLTIYKKRKRITTEYEYKSIENNNIHFIKKLKY